MTTAKGRTWLSTEDAARDLGMVSARWVRKQIELGNLPAVAMVGERRIIYRIRARDWRAFKASAVMPAADAVPRSDPDLDDRTRATRRPAEPSGRLLAR